MQPVNNSTNLSQAASGFSNTHAASSSDSLAKKYINNSSSDRLGGNIKKDLAEHDTITVVEPKVAHGSVPTDSTEIAIEQEWAAYDQLKNLMGKEVYDRFAVQLCGILYGSGAFRGYGLWVPKQVNPILNWYNAEQNKSKVEQFLNGEFQGTEAAVRLDQFIEMFVTHNALDEITRICISKDNLGAVILGEPSDQGNIYEQWKST
ncbi:hypothetical protein [Endozoicomonas sp. YOMI1]|uniref:hypothetical protein n=1 Tax=Endozoicomonas sp. YOMI1 TaxID=2828739 RepID=UPI002147A4CA|nr:hypothetical protein [Endozoicomonas sp. YOMI1]